MVLTGTYTLYKPFFHARRSGIYELYGIQWGSLMVVVPTMRWTGRE